MSDSPQSNPKDVEQGAPSGDEEAQMNDPQDPHSTGLGYEFEVKEQDRWLPIANGMSSLPLFHASQVPPLAMIRVRLWWRSSPLDACAPLAWRQDPPPLASLLPCLSDNRARAKRPPLHVHVGPFVAQVVAEVVAAGASRFPVVVQGRQG